MVVVVDEKRKGNSILRDSNTKGRGQKVLCSLSLPEGVPLQERQSRHTPKTKEGKPRYAAPAHETR